MKTLNNIIILVLLVLGVSGCNFLDRQPHELTPETYFNNEDELKTFLAGVYSPLNQEAFYGNYYSVHNAGGDDLSFFQRPSGHMGMMQANANSNNEYVTIFWRVLYDGISRANVLLEHADKNTEIPEAYRNQIKAEALFLRSFYYFNLIQGWGDVPFRITAVQSVNNLALPRTDKQVIYDQIINDIISTLPLLKKADQVNPGYVTESAAKGILARIYMFRAGEHFRDNKPADENVKKYFEEARKWALEVKNSNLHGLVNSYAQVFTDFAQDKYNSTGVKESIWEVESAGNWLDRPEKSTGRIGNTNGFGAGSIESKKYPNATGILNPGYSYNFVYGSLKLYEMYDSEGDTVRADWNLAPWEYKIVNGEIGSREYYYGKLPAGVTEIEGIPCTEKTQTASDNNKTRCAAKYRRELEVVVPKNKNYTPINFPILRYSDVLLMIAEAENEINNAPTQLAYDCLNEVRRRAQIAEYNLGALDKGTFRDVLKKERGMELCFEGIRRWDLIRWGDFYQNMQEMRNMVNQPGWTQGLRYAAAYYNVSEAYNYFPIPSLEMSVNKEIRVNNPGW